VTATAPSGYHFANWTLDAAAYSLDNPLAVSNVTASMTLVATFLANDAIAITAASAEKVYDGLPLTTNDYSYTGTLEAGHTLVSVTVAGSQTLVGVGTNVPSDAVIQDGSSNDVTHLYTITYFNGTLTVTKAPSTITVTGNASYVYNAAGQGPDAANVSGSTGDVTYSYEGTGGTSYGPSADKPVVVGTYQVVATVTEDANHFGAVSDALAFWITQATPTVTQWPSASPIIIGQALSASTLTNGSASVDGSFAFTNPEYVPSTGGFYSASATFTPTDTANYTTASGSVDVFVDASVVLPFEENFEGMNLGDLDSQNNWQAAGVVVQTNMVFEGTQAAEIVDGEGYMQREFVDSQTNVWTDFHYQPVFFAEEPTGLDPEATSMFYFNTNGHPVVYDGVTPSVISNVTVTNGDWVRVTVHSDYVAGTWDFYVNEAREAAGLGFYNAAATHYSRLTIKGAGSATVPLDAIVIDLLPPFDPLVYYTLLINSAHGTALPDVGEHSYLAGVEVTASISGSPETNGLTRYVYTGWTGSGSTPATGTETNVSFTITEDSAITWQWSTNYWIELNTAGE